MENRRAVGTKYETMAAEYLEEKGHHILERNYRCRFGEIDLISRDHQTLVFIEVKYRTSSKYGSPLEAVTAKKQQIISKVASYYCMRNRIPEAMPCRFDVIAIQGEEIQQVMNAFEYQYK